MVPVAPVVVVGGTVIVGVATVGVVDAVADVEGEPNVVVVLVPTGPATLGEHAVAMANTDTHITQTPRLPDPVREMCVLRTTTAFWSGRVPTRLMRVWSAAPTWPMVSRRRRGGADSGVRREPAGRPVDRSVRSLVTDRGVDGRWIRYDAFQGKSDSE